jgi:hypothetical protein
LLVSQKRLLQQNRAHSCPGRVRRRVRSWRKPTPHSKAHPEGGLETIPT